MRNHGLNLHLCEINTDTDARTTTKADQSVWILLVLLSGRSKAIRVEGERVGENTGNHVRANNRVKGPCPSRNMIPVKLESLYNPTWTVGDRRIQSFSLTQRIIQELHTLHIL